MDTKIIDETDGLPAPERRKAMFCVILGLALTNLGSAIVNIALPGISHSFKSNDQTTVWVVNAYQLAATVFLLPVSAMAETVGLKRIYLVGLVGFTLAALGCALSPTLALLVLARIFQGACGACISVAGVALARVIYPRIHIGKGLALVALAVAVPGALGPTIAAAILSIASWPWLFLVNIPIGGLAIIMFLSIAPPSTLLRRRFDLVGSVLNAFAFGLVVIGVSTLGSGNSSLSMGEIAAGVVCFGLFYTHQRRHPTPMIPFDLLRIPTFVMAVGTSTCSYTAQILAYISLPFMLENVFKFSPASTGLLITPWPLLTAITAQVAGHLMNRYSTAMLSSFGLAVMAVGLILTALVPTPLENWDIVWRLSLCGIGFGLFQTPNNTAMMTAGPIERSSAAAGMNAVARFTGWTLGSALVALIFALAQDHATTICLQTGAFFSLVGAIASYARWIRE